MARYKTKSDKLAAITAIKKIIIEDELTDTEERRPETVESGVVEEVAPDAKNE